MNDTPALAISGLRFRWKRKQPWIVDGTDLVLQRGKQMLVTGPSGGGKSTLLQLVAGLLEPAAGTVTIAGRNMHALRGAERDRFRGATVGMVFQTFQLLAGFSAIENVMLALLFSPAPRGEHRERAGALLRELGIDDHRRDPRDMSVGQQQRVAVARALVCAPALVLADEPTASLDPMHADRAIGLLQDACAQRGAALLCVSHDPAMKARFTRHTSVGQVEDAPCAP